MCTYTYTYIHICYTHVIICIHETLNPKHGSRTWHPPELVPPRRSWYAPAGPARGAGSRPVRAVRIRNFGGSAQQILLNE